jgi:Ca2+-binding EF-hand superfamily protein
MSYTDAQLKHAVDTVFATYDRDKSGTLEVSEIRSLINDALKHMNSNREATKDEVTRLINEVDKNKDGMISRE